MKILHYSNDVKNNINTIYTVNGSDCKYTLNHPSNLIVDAEFVGKKSNYANSQGWERDSNKYFKELYEMHPEYFSDSNKVRIMNNKAPIVNEKFLKFFPEYADYKIQILVLHHIGGDGQIVAIPQDIHSKGFGEIHNVEKNLGIRDIAMSFSNQVETQIDNGEFENGKRVTYYYDSLKERNLIDDDENEDQSIISKTSNEVTKRDETLKKESFANKVLDTMLKPVAKYLKFREEHPIISSALETTVGLGASIIANSVIDKSACKEYSKKISGDKKFNLSSINKGLKNEYIGYEENSESKVEENESNISDIIIEETNLRDYPEKRAPMTPHTRHAHLHHFGKNGEISKWLDDIPVNKNKGEGIIEGE